MKPLYVTIASLAAVCAGLLAWGGVWYLYASIIAAAEAHAATQLNAESQVARDAMQARTRALALDTMDARAELSRSVHADILSSAKLIESVGPLARATVKVSGAAEESGIVKPGGSGPQLHAIGFSVEVTGSFAAVLKAAQLLETLPLPTMIEQFDFARVPPDASGKSPAQWRLNERIRLFTDSDLPS